MKQLTVRQKRELIILAAIEHKPAAMVDIEERLREAHLPMKLDDLRDEVFRMGREHNYLTAHRLNETAPQSHSGTIAVQITEAGLQRLEDLRALCPETLVEHAEDFLRAVYPPASAFSAASGPEAVVEICLSHAALNAWWDSLSLDGKAEAFMNHYETCAAEDAEPVVGA